MTTKIVIVDSANFQVSPQEWAGAELVPLAQMKEKLPALAAQPLLVVGGNELKFDSVLQTQLENSAQPMHLLQFTSKEEAGAMAKQFSFLQNENRTAGVKSLLNTGSTIFTESFFNAFGLGAKIDCCHDLARNHLKPAVAFSAWAALQSILIVALKSLPDHGDKGTGEKVDMQIGADGQRFVCSVTFPIPANQLGDFRRHPVLTVLRSSAASFELRYHKMGSRVELIAIFFSAAGPQQAVEIQSYSPATALEDPTTVKEYTFRPLSSLREGAAAPAPASGFKKKKLSEKLAAVSPAPAPTAAPAPAAAPTLVVSGSDKLGGGKPDPALVAKIEDLQTTLNQKDHIIKQLSKEVEDLKVPGQRDVITSIKDTQVQGLKDNISRLEAELAEALEREIEAQQQSAAPAKAVEQYQKKVKDLETKLKAATDGRNAQLLSLEKQLEDSKKKIKELSKKVTDLTEALREAA